MIHDLLTLGPHFVLLGLLDFRDFGHGVYADAGAVDFYFVGVHGGVGDEDFGVGHFFGAAYADLFVHYETGFEVRVAELAAGFLYDLDVVEVS